MPQLRGTVYGARDLCRATRASPRRRRQWYGRRSRLLVFHSGAHVRAAACPRVRSAGSHAVCKIDANAYDKFQIAGPTAEVLTTPPRRGAALGVRGAPIIAATRAHSKQRLHIKALRG